MTDKDAIISKSESVRVSFKDGEFIQFAELNSRLVFTGKELNERKTREESLKFTLRLTSLAIKHVLGDSSNGLFVSDDENVLIEKIIQKAVNPYKLKEEKFNKLLDSLATINERVTFSDNEVVINQKEWNEIMNHVTTLQAF